MNTQDKLAQGWRMVPAELLDNFPEINPSNYDHDDACKLNAWGVELVLAAAPAAPAVEPWLPIEMAPKDGRTLLLGRYNEAGNWRTMRGAWMSAEYIADNWEEPDSGEPGWYETSVEADDAPNCWATTPTHWMPIPAAPGAPADQPAPAQRCQYCDGTGDVHSADGEWHGECKACDASKPAPAQQAEPQDLALRYAEGYRKGHDAGWAAATAHHKAQPKGTHEPYGFESGLVQLLDEASFRVAGNRELAGRVVKYIRTHLGTSAQQPAAQAPAEAHGDAVRAERDQLLEQLAAAQREVVELRGLKPAPPERPPHNNDASFQHPSLPRYGLRWSGPSLPVSVPMADGYWTPFHSALAALESQAQPKHIPTPEDINAQDWAGMDGATAYQLIERHGEDWSHIGRLMAAWAAANAAPAPAPAQLNVPGGPDWLLPGIVASRIGNEHRVSAGVVQDIAKALHKLANSQAPAVPHGKEEQQ